jgi:hypothetical protein
MKGDNINLPPEPGTVPHPDHGIPGPAEELPEGDIDLNVVDDVDLDYEDYDDEDGDES